MMEPGERVCVPMGRAEDGFAVMVEPPIVAFAGTGVITGRF